MLTETGHSVIPETKAKQPIQASMPTPGGPQGEQMSVRDALSRELAEAGQVATQTQQRLGVRQEKVPEHIRGIRSGANVVYNKIQMQEREAAFNDAIDDMFRQANVTDMQEMTIGKSMLMKELKEAEFKLAKIANEFNKKLAREKIDGQKKANLWGSLAGIATAIGAGIMTGGNPYAVMGGYTAGSKLGQYGSTK